MPCYHPVTAWRKRSGPRLDGSWPLTFSSLEGDASQPVVLPCGRCIGCKERKAREWTLRCCNEAQMHDTSCFITLTYREETCPESLDKKEFQRFMKRLRKGIFKKYGKHIRFFSCGEYGRKYQRPHYHAAIFGYSFPDRTLWQERGLYRLYRSVELEERWPYGFSVIAELDYACAAYIAGYCSKKIRGPIAKFRYDGKVPEFCLASRNPGLGKKWLEKFQSDCYPSDKIIIPGTSLTYRPPKYYDSNYTDIEHQKHMRQTKIKPLTQKQLDAMELNHYARNKIYRKEREFEDSGISCH